MGSIISSRVSCEELADIKCQFKRIVLFSIRMNRDIGARVVRSLHKIILVRREIGGR